MTKLIFTTGILVFSTWARAGVRYEVVLRDDGSVLAATRAEAERACAERQARLATTREFAEIARERGAVGSKEPRLPNTPPAHALDSRDIQGPRSEAYNNSVAGFEQILKTEEGGATVVDFYYSRQNFKCWAGDLDHDFWTSTDVGAKQTYLFLGRESRFPGALYLADVDAEARHAVLCVRAE